MAKNKSGIQKEKKPFDKTYIPLGFAILILVLLVGSLVYVITRKPKDVPVLNPTNTVQIEEMVVDTNSTTCSNDEVQKLISEAKKITAKYEEIDDYLFFSGQKMANFEDEEDQTMDIYGYALRMTLDNIESYFLIRIRNDIDDSILYDETGKSQLSWDEGETAYVRTYYVDVFANTDTCKNIIVRTFSFKVPKWNEMSKLGVCKDPSIRDKEICKHFTFSNKSFQAQFRELEEESKKAGKEEYAKSKEDKQIAPVKYVKNHKVLFIIIGIVVVLSVIVIIILKGRRKNEK